MTLFRPIDVQAALEHVRAVKTFNEAVDLVRGMPSEIVDRLATLIESERTPVSIACVARGDRREWARSSGGGNPYSTSRVRPVIVPYGVTKWDLMGDADRVAADHTPFTTWDGEPGKCTACGADISTEGKFARHFVVPDARYWNLGDCPKVGH